MSIKIILKKDGKFPDTHVGNSTTLKSKGIHCAVTQDVMAAKRKNIFERIKAK